MSGRSGVHAHSLRRVVALMVVGVMAALLVRVAWAGLAGFRNSAVGGISISADGVVGPPSIEARNMVLTELRKEVKTPAGELGSAAPLRMVSLRGLEAALDEVLKAGTGVVPDEVRFLAGIQRIEYVFVYPEDNDIVLAGPGEGWKVDDKANVVGVTTGRPALRLDDFLVALRTVGQSRMGGITCSIDPTEEGIRAFRELMDRQRRNRSSRAVLEAAIKQAFGNQQVKFEGVPSTTHFARVLLAADYRMKRIAMQLEPSPVRGLPSYVQMITSGGGRAPNNANPRWWLACNYEPLAASEDRLAWQLRGPGVKAMTEDEISDAQGRIRATGRSSAAAEKWASLMTDKYDELSTQETIFGELRNVMDLCVIAALLEKEWLWDRAGLKAPLLRSPQSAWQLEVWNAPKVVPPEVSLVQARDGLIVTASGGVQLTPWQVASAAETSSQVADTRKKASPQGKSLWWQ